MFHTWLDGDSELRCDSAHKDLAAGVAEFSPLRLVRFSKGSVSLVTTVIMKEQFGALGGLSVTSSEKKKAKEDIWPSKKPPNYTECHKIWFWLWHQRQPNSDKQLTAAVVLGT